MEFCWKRVCWSGIQLYLFQTLPYWLSYPIFFFQRFVMRAVKWISNSFKNESVNARSWVVSFDFFCFFRFSKLSLYFHCLILIVRMCYYAKYNFHLDFLSFFYDLGDLLNQTHILMISTVLTLFYSSLID